MNPETTKKWLLRVCVLSFLGLLVLLCTTAFMAHPLMGLAVTLICITLVTGSTYIHLMKP